MVKTLPEMPETWARSLDCEDPWRRELQSTPVFLPGESHGQRSLQGCRPRGRKQLDTTDTHTHTEQIPDAKPRYSSGNSSKLADGRIGKEIQNGGGAGGEVCMSV